MPKELTHWMLAERVLAALPPGGRVQRAIAGHRAAYLGGAVLPDTLAHICSGPYHPAAPSLSRRFHDTSGNSYAPLIRAERRLPQGMPDPLFSCFLGVICHIQGDVALHPYVYAVGGNSCIGEHYRLETGIDLHFLRQGGVPAERRLDRLLSPQAREVMLSAARHLFDPNEELPHRALEQSLALHCRYQAMYDQTLWKIAVRVLGRVCGSPFKEQRHLFYPIRRTLCAGTPLRGAQPWRHPESREMRSVGVEELAGEAVRQTVALFAQIEERGSLEAALSEHPGANLLTGLHGVAKNP